MMSIIDRMKLHLGPLFVGMTFIAVLSACSDRDDHDHPDLKSGADLFNYHCAECHGEDGTGKLADRTPANILTRRSRDEIVNYITKNINPQREMPVFSTMPYLEAVAIANHLHDLQQIYYKTPDNKKKPRQLLIEP